MVKTVLIIVIFLLGAIKNIYSQEIKVEVSEADKNFGNYAYIDAINIYEKVAQQGYRSAELFQRLGDSYYFNARYEEAAKWYGELFKETPEPSSEYLYRYSQCLKSLGDFEKANFMMQRFTRENTQDIRGRIYKDRKDYLEMIKENSGRYQISDAGVNSQFSDYGPAFFGDKLVFTSSRDAGGHRKIDKWNNQAYSNLYVSTMGTDGNFSGGELFSSSLHPDFHESTAIFTKDGKTMYFTRNSNHKNKKKTEDIIKLKLFKATFDGRNWDDAVELPFNSDDFSSAHPALSPDEKTLYFVSDRPGSIGQSDLYRVSINSDGSFGNPENLGKAINTEGRETFPFVSGDNELYFSSDGYPGLGGLDIYRVKTHTDGSFAQPVNVGEPINGSDDDFSFIINSATKKGFFTSNRKKASASDDIYKFIELKTLSDDAGQHRPIVGVVTDPKSGEPLEGVRVTVYDNNYNKLREVVTSKDGKYDLGELGYGNYYIKMEKPDYETTEINTAVSKTQPEENPVSQNLNKLINELKQGDDIAGILNIRNIYFDLNEWNIRSDAGVDLAKLLVFMRHYPQIKIEVRAHTDSRGNRDYNQYLSGKRAASTLGWLIDNGIDRSRLSGRGYGETRLLNNCPDGVDCTEQQHQQNRRCEFIITWDTKKG